MATANVTSELTRLLSEGEETIIRGWLKAMRAGSDTRISDQEAEITKLEKKIKFVQAEYDDASIKI